MSPELRNIILRAEHRQLQEEFKAQFEEDVLLSVSVKENEQAFLEKSLQELITDEIQCPNEWCRCKPRQLRKIRARPLKILTHTFHYNEIFLYCRLDSEKTIPEYRRQCEVDANLRRAYVEKLQELQRVPSIKEVWTRDDEAKYREVIHPALSERDLRIQQQLPKCKNTDEWDRFTNNGKELHKIKTKKEKPPGPVEMDDGLEYYEVEKILGAVLNKGTTYYLIKWVGWDSSHNSWEKARALKGRCDPLTRFLDEYGRVTWHKPKILTPEGEDFERYVAVVEKAENAKNPNQEKKSTLPFEPCDELELPDSGIKSENTEEESEKEALPVSSKRKKKSKGSKRKAKKEAQVFAVEEIIGAALSNSGKSWYLVKWEGFELAMSTWEEETSCVGATKAIEKFFKTHEKPTYGNPKILSELGKQREAFADKLSNKKRKQKDFIV